jgi:hypothetical protein
VLPLNSYAVRRTSIQPVTDKHLFGITDLLSSEARVLQTTEVEASAFLRNYPGAMDLMFNLSYFWGELPPPDTPRGLFAFFASSNYLQAPYTAWALFDIWKRGYYLESSILLRNLLEVLVQLRYFHRHPDRLEAHLHPERASVRFADMFEDVAPGYYRKYYGQLLSAFAHGKGGQLYFRYDHADPNNRRIRMGCEYDRDHMSWVINQLGPLLFGFLSFFPIFFPANTVASDDTISYDLADAIRWLESGMRVHRTGFSQSEPWYQVLDRLIRPQ